MEIKTRLKQREPKANSNPHTQHPDPRRGKEPRVPAAGELGPDAAEEGSGLAGEHGAHDDVDLAIDPAGRPDRRFGGGKRGRGVGEGHGRSEKDGDFEFESREKEKGRWRRWGRWGGENAMARLQV